MATVLFIIPQIPEHLRDYEPLTPDLTPNKNTAQYEGGKSKEKEFL